MNERMREARTALKLSQEEFGRRIGLSKFAISNYENNKQPITERSISNVCREYGVREEWLRNGVGDMFTSEYSSAIARIVKDYRLDDIDAAILETYVRLPVSSRAVLKSFILSVANKKQPSDFEGLDDIIFTKELEEDLRKGREKKQRDRESS